MDIAELAGKIGNLEGTVLGLTQTIQTTTAQQREDINKLFTGLNGVKAEILRLPCSQHSDDIEELQGWKKNCNGVKQAREIENYKGGISMKNAIIAIVLTALISNIPNIIMLFTRPVMP